MTNNLIDGERLPSELDSQKNGVWGAALTLVWGLVLLLAWGILQTLFGFYGAYLDGNFDQLLSSFSANDEDGLLDIMLQGKASWMQILPSSVLIIALVWIIIRLKRDGLSFTDYLHLKGASAKDWLIWMGGFVLLIFGMELLAPYIDGMETDFMRKMVGNTDSLILLTIGVGVIGPIFEEILFRGFVFKGWENDLGGHVTVIVTSVLFAFLHAGQYNLTVTLAIIPMGMLLGYARLYSGSLLIPIAMHMTNNLLSTYLTMRELDAVPETALILF